MLNNIPETDFLPISNDGIHLIESTIWIVAQHQTKEEILKSERELSTLIYYKRNSERS